MTPDPVILAAPAILHHDDRHTVWHAGVVLGPSGTVVINLDIDSMEQKDWGLGPTSQPVRAHIEVPGQNPSVVVGQNGYSADPHTLKFDARFPSKVRGKAAFPPLTRKQLDGATLHIEIHPLDLYLTINL